MRRARAISALLALVVTLFVSPALAQRVLLVQPPVADETLAEAFNRLRAELGLQGFDTKIVVLDGSAQTPDALADLAQKEGAFAAISLTRNPSSTNAQVCVADRVTGKISWRSLALGNAKDAPSVLAVRATDLLRSSLSELASSAAPPPEVAGVDRTTVPKEVVAFAQAPVARFRLGVRAAALGLGQELGLGYAPSLELHYHLLDRVELGVLFAGPAFGAKFRANAGTAVARQMLGGATASLVALRAQRFELRPSLFAGGYRVDVSGEVDPPYAGRSGQVTSFAAGVGLDASVRLGDRVSLGAGALALGLTPRPAVAVLSEEDRFSFPFLALNAGFGVDF